MTETYLPLNTGAKIPALGLGTWQSAPGEVTKAVLHALKSGYRHIDAAYVYGKNAKRDVRSVSRRLTRFRDTGNEDEVGEALKEAFSTGIVKREDIFVTTKLWCTYHSRPEENLDLSLKSLGLDYVDLYLMHWPCPMNPKGASSGAYTSITCMVRY